MQYVYCFRIFVMRYRSTKYVLIPRLCAIPRLWIFGGGVGGDAACSHPAVYFLNRLVHNTTGWGRV